MDLSEVATEDLLIELLDRFDHGAFIGGSYESVSVIRRKWKGNSHTVAGQLLDLATEVLEDYRSRSQPL